MTLSSRVPEPVAWDPVAYGAHAAFVADLAGPVVTLLAARPGERILDLGCGDGRLTARLAEGGARVTGLEPDARMAAAARGRGVDVVESDAQALAFDAAFDAVFSNAALHWMPDQPAVLAGVFRALVPGGRFVGECGGRGNVAAIRAALRAEVRALGGDPGAAGGQHYPDCEGFTLMARAAGFADVAVELVHRPTPLATGIGGWLETFRGSMLEATGVADIAQLFARVEDTLRPILTDGRGGWWADYVRLRWSCRKDKA